MSRAIIVSLSMLMASAVPATPAFATAAAGQSADGRQCEQTPARSTRRSILGGIAGGLIGRAVGSNRVTSTIGSWIPAQTMLADALLNLLDCDEQQKAAKATEDVTAQGETRGAGATVAWRSESRPGVSGRSTVTAVDNSGQSGRRCMTVTDVVIIDGEETTMPKRMCRQPPSTRYARV
jgi:hypothetical protein